MVTRNESGVQINDNKLTDCVNERSNYNFGAAGNKSTMVE